MILVLVDNKIANKVPNEICIVTPTTINFTVTDNDSIKVGSWNKYVNWPKPKNILGRVGEIGQIYELTYNKYKNG